VKISARKHHRGVKTGSSEKFESAVMEAVEFEGEITFVA
jgi:hypothetical protein